MSDHTPAPVREDDGMPMPPEPPRYDPEAGPTGERVQLFPSYDPEAGRLAYEDQIVGPHGETRAQMRAMQLGRLDDLRREVEDAQARGIIQPLEGFKLRLRIHRERCGLLGLPVGIGEPW